MHATFKLERELNAETFSAALEVACATCTEIEDDMCDNCTDNNHVDTLFDTLEARLRS